MKIADKTAASFHHTLKSSAGKVLTLARFTQTLED
jgi:hypothetical protein